ncbi:hypothetical protein [uncultured Nostoc sp.]|uniref:hypothetical protein n=1 Tax=uncultured Nostoc sp. TaxID=340711 RepID=UPI0035CAEA9A
MALTPKSHPRDASDTLTFKELMGLERFSKTFLTLWSKRSLFEEKLFDLLFFS